MFSYLLLKCKQKCYDFIKSKKVIEVRNLVDIDMNYVSAINSRMIIRKDVFFNFKYNENNIVYISNF